MCAESVLHVPLRSAAGRSFVCVLYKIVLQTRGVQCVVHIGELEEESKNSYTYYDR